LTLSLVAFMLAHKQVGEESPVNTNVIIAASKS